jgi:hypothetical protein
MCIAIVKEKGIDLPNKELLKTCWDNNPDGAGYMFNEDGIVSIYKGYMTFNSFYASLKKLDKLKNLKDRNVVIHFRIATQGMINPENTHPFPITHDYDLMTRKHINCKYGFAHNGIIWDFGNENYSDTMEFNSYILSKIHDIEHSDDLIHALANLYNSRFVVLTGERVILGGEWQLDNDLWFSNDTYKFKKSYDSWYDKAKNYFNYKPKSCVSCGKKSKKLKTTTYGDLCPECYKLI